MSLPYSLTVMENLLVFARIYGVKEPKKKIMELLSIFEIDAAGGSIFEKTLIRTIDSRKPRKIPS